LDVADGSWFMCNNATIFAVSRLALLQTMPLAQTVEANRRFGLKFKNLNFGK